MAPRKQPFVPSGGGFFYWVDDSIVRVEPGPGSIWVAPRNDPFVPKWEERVFLFGRFGFIRDELKWGDSNDD